MTNTKPLLVDATASQDDAHDRQSRAASDSSATAYHDQLWTIPMARQHTVRPLVQSLPLAGLSIENRSTTAYYAISTMEARGRLGDQSPLRVLRWQPGLRIDIAPYAGFVMIRPHTSSSEAVARQGHLRLPARVRRACHLSSGDRLLMAAYPDQNLLAVYTMASLDTMILTHAAARQAAA